MRTDIIFTISNSALCFSGPEQVFIKFYGSCVLNEIIFSTGAYDSILSSYNRSRDAERLANESAITKSSIVVQSGNTRRRTERLMTVKKDDFNRKNAANKRTLGDFSSRLQGLDMKKVNEKVGHSLNSITC